MSNNRNDLPILIFWYNRRMASMDMKMQLPGKMYDIKVKMQLLWMPVSHITVLALIPHFSNSRFLVMCTLGTQIVAKVSVSWPPTWPTWSAFLASGFSWTHLIHVRHLERKVVGGLIFLCLSSCLPYPSLPLSLFLYSSETQNKYKVSAWIIVLQDSPPSKNIVVYLCRI